VRDHARLLAEDLTTAESSCTFHWLSREERSLRGARSEIRAWAGELEGSLAERRPDAILLHYSVFSYSHRGLPLFVTPILGALRSSRAPLVTVLHEYAYPWRLGDWRGNVWAVAQRAALISVMRASCAAITTGDARVAWLTSRRWLPRRRVLLAPVFSNLPAPDPRKGGQGSLLIGLFGYSYQGAAVSLILDALHELRSRGLGAQLRLLGAPGPSSSAGAAWLSAARERGLEEALSFSGALPAQELSNALAECATLLFVDRAGPTSRKGTLAASLASGRPVVALDGPQTWSELVQGAAARVVEPTARALADALALLLEDEDAREAQGRRGRSFAEHEMGLSRTTEAVRSLLADPRCA
jgi:glycosyltransferase involved in cell wall biosynthesis